MEQVYSYNHGAHTGQLQQYVKVKLCELGVQHEWPSHQLKHNASIQTYPT